MSHESLKLGFADAVRKYGDLWCNDFRYNSRPPRIQAGLDASGVWISPMPYWHFDGRTDEWARTA